MAIALTPFKALCGFRPLSSIATYLKSTPEFAALISPTALSHFESLPLSHSSTSGIPTPAEKAALKDVWASLMTADAERVKLQSTKLVDRYRSNLSVLTAEEDELRELVLTLNRDFPGDVGMFCPFMLNFVNLGPGEAIFLGAGEPHAYVSGCKHIVPTPRLP
jgi:mannose-6-phosphate isomerase